jgi:hypothetical protein
MYDKDPSAHDSFYQSQLTAHIDAHHWTVGTMAGNVEATSYPGCAAVKFLAYNYILVRCDAM